MIPGEEEKKEEDGDKDAKTEWVFKKEKEREKEKEGVFSHRFSDFQWPTRDESTVQCFQPQQNQKQGLLRGIRRTTPPPPL